MNGRPDPKLTEVLYQLEHASKLQRLRFGITFFSKIAPKAGAVELLQSLFFMVLVPAWELAGGKWLLAAAAGILFFMTWAKLSAGW